MLRLLIQPLVRQREGDRKSRDAVRKEKRQGCRQGRTRKISLQTREPKGDKEVRRERQKAQRQPNRSARERRVSRGGREMEN